MKYDPDTRNLRARVERKLRECDDEMSEEEAEMADRILAEGDDADFHRDQIG